ncbi:MAG: TIGR00180 family glycosyltransferase [Actinomycetota bacterium]|nr:TIGR00180 family glycosyltransferase [Actinomycetota bacterium]
MLTVVVPSMNRQDYLLRQIRYWASSSVSLIVVDGSTQPLDDRVRSAIGGHRRLTYLHEQSSFADRLNLASGLIETPYSVMLGDDEFHLPSGLCASLSVLEADPDLVGCMGQALSFSPVGQYRRIVFARVYPSLHGYGIRHSDPADRLIAAMSDYTMATCYAVLRTPIWQRSWGSLEEYSSGAAQELQQAMAVHLLGPISTTSHIQWLRSIENPNLPLTPEEEDGKIWFPEWWESPRFMAERSRYTTTLATAVTGELAVGHEECSAWVAAGAEAFVDRWQTLFQGPSDRSASQLLLLTGRIFRRLVRLLPDSLFLWAKRLRGSALRALGRPGGAYYGTADGLSRIIESEGLALTVGDVEELSRIEAMVREFHALIVDETQDDVRSRHYLQR